ncbi:hypothetical protein Gotur_035109, partial [Gossypium turneri]
MPKCVDIGSSLIRLFRSPLTS